MYPSFKNLPNSQALRQCYFHLLRKRYRSVWEFDNKFLNDGHVVGLTDVYRGIWHTIIYTTILTITNVISKNLLSTGTKMSCETRKVRVDYFLKSTSWSIFIYIIHFIIYFFTLLMSRQPNKTIINKNKAINFDRHTIRPFDSRLSLDIVRSFKCPVKCSPMVCMICNYLR